MDLLSPVSTIPFVGSIYTKRLEKLDIKTVEDLFLHTPSRYLDYRLVSDIARVQVGEIVTIEGEILSITNQYTKSRKKIQIAQVADLSGKISVIWFNQPYLLRTFKKGLRVAFSGKVNWFGRKKALISPEYEVKSEGKSGIHTGRLVPIYPETAQLSSKWLRNRITSSFPLVKNSFQEFLPFSVLEKYHLCDLSTAIEKIHFPKTEDEAAEGRKRLAFDELLILHLKSLRRKSDWRKNKVLHKLKIEKDEVTRFINSLPFPLTNSQNRAIDELLADLKSEIPMNRLLEGDVGSGKTVVAAVACLVSFLNGHQSVIMAPTQILAQQHFETLNQVFKNYKIRLGLITSAGIKKDAGNIDIFVGTHALIHRKLNFDNLAIVVIDEQHRFGVKQRACLTRTSKGKTFSPHVLTMTATPIPRTIALTALGDLELSTLDELPKGRKPITTWLVPPQKREGAYQWIRSQIKEKGVQAFIICPLIEESETETMKQVKAATAEYKKLKKVFKDLQLGLLHGRQKAKEKYSVLEKFRKGKTHLLVATPVVEVGIDIANATIMLIEAAERFGLAQLHQLRGRIGRSEKKSYCLLFSQIKSPKGLSRLNIMKKTMSGFELAEADLKLRGPGEILGTKQHGFEKLKIASWSDSKLIRDTKKTADEALENPKKFSSLFQKLISSNIVMN